VTTTRYINVASSTAESAGGFSDDGYGRDIIFSKEKEVNPIILRGGEGVVGGEDGISKSFFFFFCLFFFPSFFFSFLIFFWGGWRARWVRQNVSASGNRELRGDWLAGLGAGGGGNAEWTCDVDVPSETGISLCFDSGNRRRGREAGRREPIAAKGGFARRRSFAVAVVDGCWRWRAHAVGGGSQSPKEASE